MGILKKIIKNIKKQKKLRTMMANNNIQVPKNIQLNINGKNNTVLIKSKLTNKHSHIKINIYGNNNSIIIDEDVSLSGTLQIIIGNNHKNFAPVENCTFSIGKKTSIESLQYCTFNSGAFCSIGEYCMFSYEIKIFNTDAHPIFDKDTSNIINYVDGITIGNHVWIGAHVTILKNTTIPDNCIVGHSAVIVGKFKEQDCAMAGNPAKIVRKNISWDFYSYEYCQNNKTP